jgi:hypothetical protein
MGLIGNDFAPRHQIFSDFDKFNERSDFAFIQLMNGTSLETEFLQRWWNVHIPKSPYLVLKWWIDISKQINDFYNAVLAYASNFSLPPMIDVENLLLTSGQISLAFELSKSMFGNYPIPYSSINFWPKSYPDYLGVPNFVANYPNSLKNLRYSGAEEKIITSMENGFPNMPVDWGEFTPKEDFWQCSKSGHGPDWGLDWNYSKAIDVDYFDGTKNDLQAVMDKWSGSVVTPPGGIIPIKEVIVTSSAGLNIRSLPDADSKDIGSLVVNSQVPVVDQKGKWYEIRGHIHSDYTKDVI